MRTVVAVTAPVLLAVPNAVTQSPTATAEDVVVWVSDSVVDVPVVILSFCVLGFVCFVDFEVDERLKSWLRSVPDIETVEPLIAVDLPRGERKIRRTREPPTRTPTGPGREAPVRRGLP